MFGTMTGWVLVCESSVRLITGQDRAARIDLADTIEWTGETLQILDARGTLTAITVTGDRLAVIAGQVPPDAAATVSRREGEQANPGAGRDRRRLRCAVARPVQIATVAAGPAVRRRPGRPRSSPRQGRAATPGRRPSARHGSLPELNDEPDMAVVRRGHPQVMLK